jgi:hypothetical protein
MWGSYGDIQAPSNFNKVLKYGLPFTQLPQFVQTCLCSVSSKDD